MTKPSASENRAANLSYKYQRVRERLRRAVESGELAGKLPGERELSRRYEANPKTINKALTDLATEGLVVRHVGRGTFVARETATEAGAGAGAGNGPIKRCTFGYVVPAGEARTWVQELYRRTAAVLEHRGHALEQMPVPMESTGELCGRRLGADRLRAFDGLALPGIRPSAALLAGAAREHVPLVMVNNQHDQMRTAAVLIDYAQGAFELCQHLIYLGHREIRLCVDPALMPAANAALTGYRAAMRRNGLPPRAVCGADAPFEAASVLAAGEGNRPTAIICAGSEAAAAVMKAASAQNHEPPSLCCIPEPCDPAAAQRRLTAYEVNPDHIAHWIAELFMSASPARWQRVVIVPGTLVDRESTSAPASETSPTRTPDAAEL